MGWGGGEVIEWVGGGRSLCGWVVGRHSVGGWWAVGGGVG